jgi:hypothetical protein
MTSTIAAYRSFIAAKGTAASSSGFQTSGSWDSLFPHQRATLDFACSKGRSAAFLDTGLGKSRVEAAITRSDLTPFGIRTVCHLFSGGTTQALRQVPQEQLEKIPTWITRPDNIAAFNAGKNPRTGEVVLVPEPSDLEDPEDQSLLSLAGAAA